MENVRQRIFEKILSREDIPGEFGSQKEVEAVAERIENAYKERLRESRLSSESEREHSSLLPTFTARHTPMKLLCPREDEEIFD